MLIFVLDNYDSFTYNLVQYIGALGAEPLVTRNDTVSVDDVARIAPDAVVISPGPGEPSSAGITIPLVRWCVGKLPLLGVCLGHQGIAEALGGRIVRADRLMHGKVSPIAHEGTGVLRDIESPFIAMRYHSLIVDPDCLPEELDVTAWSDDRPRGREIMGLQHRTEPVFGVQFHPESVGTRVGMELMGNFLSLV